MTISGVLLLLLVIKILNIIVFFNLSVYTCILVEISAYHLQLKCMGSHLFSGHPHIESTTVLCGTITIRFKVSILLLLLLNYYSIEVFLKFFHVLNYNMTIAFNVHKFLFFRIHKSTPFQPNKFPSNTYMHYYYSYLETLLLLLHVLLPHV